MKRIIESLIYFALGYGASSAILCIAASIAITTPSKWEEVLWHLVIMYVSLGFAGMLFVMKMMLSRN